MNWTVTKNNNIHNRPEAFFEWISLKSDLKDRTIDLAICHLYEGDLFYFQYSKQLFVVSLDKKIMRV